MIRAVFLDALGTLLELEPPWVLLRSKVSEEVSDEQLAAAVRTEMDYYREHAQEGRDRASLADLRERCAGLISDLLGVEITAEELVEAVKLDPYPDAEPAMRELRDRGLQLVVVSNWDCSLGDVLERCGLRSYLDGTVTSAESGSRKPDPGIFVQALELAGCGPEEALHVGDTPEEDREGALAAGIRPLVIDREGAGGGEITSLGQIVQHL